MNIRPDEKSRAISFVFLFVKRRSSEDQQKRPCCSPPTWIDIINCKFEFDSFSAPFRRLDFKFVALDFGFGGVSYTTHTLSGELSDVRGG